MRYVNIMLCLILYSISSFRKIVIILGARRYYSTSLLGVSNKYQAEFQVHRLHLIVKRISCFCTSYYRAVTGSSGDAAIKSWGGPHKRRCYFTRFYFIFSDKRNLVHSIQITYETTQK